MKGPDEAVAGVVLAAGGSSRWGPGSKLLAPLDGGRTVVESVALAARRAGLEPVVAVLGHRAEEVRRALPEGVETVRNPEWAAGRSGSLAAGLRRASARPEVAAAVVLLGDEPGVEPEVIRAVRAAWREGEAEAVRTRYRDRPGHPVLFARSCFAELGRLEGDRGALRWLERAGEAGRLRTVRIETEAPRDVDTREDHRRLSGGRLGGEP